MFKLNNSLRSSVFVLLFIFGISSYAYACSLTGLQHEVKFDSDEPTLGKKEAVALAQWFADQRDVRSYDEIDIVSMYPAASKKLAEISRKRMQNISRLIDSMNANRISVALTISEGQQEELGPVGYVYHEVLVVMSPSCARAGACCNIRVN